MSSSLSRREFLRQASLAGAAGPLALGSTLVDPAPKRALAANERLNVGVIGVAGRGASNLKGVSEQNIVALCDIDANRLDGAASRFPLAKTYDDYRRVIDHKELDCVVVSTPDHMHAIPAVAALKAGFDVYCEKPMAHSVWEVRQMRDWAAKQKAVTQLGTQIHAGDNYRRVVEVVRSGMLGPVTRVHIWLGSGNRIFTAAQAKPQKVPNYINYDLWTGPAPMRPYSPAHFHFNWRFWWDYGSGQFGDFVCHYMDLPFWALALREPLTVKAEGSKGYEGANNCPNNLRVDWKYPMRGDLAPVHVTWYMGKYRPPEFKEFGGGMSSAVLFEGSKGRLVANYGSHKFFMENDEKPTSPEPSIPNSIGHHAEFIEAVKTRGKTTCNFDYSGALTEAGLLGNVSYRVGGKELVWDAKNLRAKNCPEADQYIRTEYRKGWKL